MAQSILESYSSTDWSEDQFNLAQSILESYTDWSEDQFLDDEEEARKFQVDQYIKKSVLECRDYADVKHGVREINKSPLDFRETQYVKEKYVNCCLQAFYGELNHYLNHILKQVYTNKDCFHDLVEKFLQSTKSIEAVAENFQKVKHIGVVVNCVKEKLMSKNETKQFLEKVSQICLQKLSTASYCLGVEKQFFDALDTCIITHFKNHGLADPLFDNAVKFESDEGTIQALFCFLASTVDSKYEKAKSLLPELGDVRECSDVFRKSIVQLLRDSLILPAPKCATHRGNKIVEFKGRCVSLLQIAEQVSKLGSDSFDEVQVYAQKLLAVDTSLKWPGKNLVIIVPEMIVNGNVVIDVSGRNGKTLFSSGKADSGQNSGEDGKPGINGENGESGGNVGIICDRIQNPDQIIIRSNGGDGSNGQDGGDGKDGDHGSDGKSMSQAEFKERFPNCTGLLEGGILDSGAFAKNMKNFATKTTEKYDKKSVFGSEWKIMHCIGTTKEGYEVEFSYYHFANVATTFLAFAGYPTNQAYCLVKGLAGTPGQRGGDGGCGGKAGLGGYPGVVKLMDMKSNDLDVVKKVENHPGKDGQSGKNGKGGKGGKNGTRGMDHGCVEPSNTRSARYYEGHLSLEVEHAASPDNAWCENKQCYIAIKDKRLTSTLQVEGKTGHVKLTNETRLSRTRKKAIQTEDIFTKYNSMFSSNLYEQFSATLGITNRGSVNISYKTDKERQHKTVTVLRPSPKTESTIPRPKFEHAILLHPSNTHPRSINSQDHQVISPIQNRSVNIHIANIIKTSEKASTFSEWMQNIKKLLEAIENKSVTQEEDSYEIEAIVENFLRKLQLFDINGKTAPQLFRILERWNLLNLTICKQTWHDINAVLTVKYRYMLLNDLAQYIREAVEKESDDDNRVVLQQDLYKAIINIQTTEGLQDMDKEIKRQKTHVDEGIPVKLTNETLVTIMPSIQDLQQQLLQQIIDESESITPQENHFEHEYSEWKRLACDIPDKVMKRINKITYLQEDDRYVLLKILFSRLGSETLRIEHNVLQWLITRIIMENVENGLSDFIVLFATKPQDMWLAEYVILQLNNKLKISQKEFMPLQKKLTEQYSHHEILLLLSQQLALLEQENVVQASDIITILELSDGLDIDDAISQQLQHISISNWSYRLHWFANIIEIEKLPLERKLVENELFEAAYHFSQLQNKYGDSSVRKFQDILKQQQNVDISTLLNVLKKFESNHWIFCEEILTVLNMNPMGSWIDTVDRKLAQGKDRVIEDLIQLMKYDSNNSEAVLTNLDYLMNVVNAINKCDESPSKIVETPELINRYDRGLIENWVKCIHQKDDTSVRAVCVRNNIEEVVAVVNQAIKLIKKFSLRDTQKLAVAMFFSSEKGILQQVATGEGKSLIIVTAAIVKALSGENVDIITSSSVLAVRDAGLYAELYGLFGVSVGHNCSEMAADRKIAYTGKDVVYGTVGDFQRDILLDDFYDEDVGIGSRKPGYVIVDEVDSLLLDKSQNLLYLSHSLPCMDLLEPVYVYIWNYIHSKGGMHGSEGDIKYVMNHMINAMYGIMTEDELQVRFPGSANLWGHLQKKQLIGADGRLLIRNDIENYCRSGEPKGKLIEVFKLEITKREQQVLLSYFKDKVRQGTMIEVPKYLQEFVDLHLVNWIESAFAARHMTQNDHYVIDSDQSEVAASAAPNIVIMDKDTGVEQYHSQWSNGLHQFLQLKHGTRLSYEGLKAVFISNVRYFDRYGPKLFGLTGTLGSKEERDLLKSVYGIEYATVPSFRPSRFTKEMTLVCQTEEEWFETIANSSKLIAEDRPVLVICESVRDVEKLEKWFHGHPSIHVYKRSYEPLTVGTDAPIDSGCIIIATNLAGRGTDIQISDRVSDLGGMHVCLTYLPPNVRVEEQAFGRAGRKGQRGTGQLVCFDGGYDNQESDNMLEVIKMKMKRNIEEEEHTDQIQKNYESVIKVEEDFFQQFHMAYKALQQAGRSEEKEMRLLVLRNCLDEWAFCLDKASQQHSNAHKEKIVDDFVTQLHEAAQTFEAGVNLIKGPVQCIKAAKILLKHNEYKKANEMLNQLIQDDDKFSEIAHYYKCHAIAAKSGLDSDTKKAEFVCNLQCAEKLFKKRCQTLVCCSQVVSMISQSYTEKRESFLHADDYAKQKEDMVNLLQVFLTSIQDMLGHSISPSKFITRDSDQLLHMHLVYQKLLEKGLLESAKVVGPIRQSSWDELQDKYQCYFNELAEVIEKYNNKDVTPQTFAGILPSREEFWQVLIDDNVLSDEKQFVVIDNKKLESLMNSCKSKTIETIIKSIINTRGDIEKHFCDNIRMDTETDSRDVCLYPEQIAEIKGENTKVVSLKLFENKFGNIEHWKMLLEEKAVQINKTAILQNKDTTKLSKWDDLQPEVFAEINGIDKIKSKEIYECVKDCTHESLNMVEEKLNNYWQYQTEIESVIAKHFLYAKALQDLVSTGYTNLDSQPFENLFGELVDLCVVKPVMVNTTVNLEKSTTEIFGREQGKVTKSDLSKLCSGKENAVWSVLKEQSCIDESSNQEAHLICKEEHLADMKDIPAPVLVLLANIIAQRENAATLASNLESWKTGLEKFNCSTTVLTSLEETVKPQKSEEIALCETNGLEDVVSLSERKWTWSSLGKIALVALIGLAQIALGVAIEFFSMGSLTFVASALISEGCSDLIFAVECMFSGHCDWNTYLEHKKFSLMMTAATAGVGMLVSRGAKFSKFGYKFGRSHLQHLCGKELIKEVGMTHATIAVARRIGQKAIETAAVGLTNGVIDNFVNQKLNYFYHELSQSIISKKSNVHDSNLKKQMEELAKKVGVTKAKEILSQLMYECLHGDAMCGIKETMGQIGRTLSNGIGLGVKKMGKCGHIVSSILSKLGSWLGKFLDIKSHLATIQKIVTTMVGVTRSLVTKIESKIEDIKIVQNAEDTGEVQITSCCDEMMDNWTKQMTGHVETVLSEEVGKPLLKQGAQKILFSVGRQMKTLYAKHQNKLRQNEFQSIMDEHKNAQKFNPTSGGDESQHDQLENSYQKALLDLLKKTRDPLLFAEIVRENIPLGIHCVQAIAELARCPIVIKVLGGGDSMTMPPVFRPSCHPENMEPICLTYIPGEDGFCGHFQCQSSENEVKKSGQYNCLLDAVSSQLEHPISRADIANKIKNDPECQAGIVQGIHKYISATGGALVSSKKTKRRLELLRPKTAAQNGKLLRELMDKAVKEKGANHGTGNHELLQRSQYPEWIIRSNNQCAGKDLAGNSYDYNDLHCNLRVDTRYVIWKCQDGTLAGHSGALYSNTKTSLTRALYSNTKTSLTKGQESFHSKVTTEVLKANSADEAAGLALSSHLNNIIKPQQLKYMTRQKLNGIQTAYGYDLSNVKEKSHFCRGFEREYYKIYLVAEKFSAPNLPDYKPPLWLQNDTKMKNIETEINKSRSVEDFSRVLTKPAPYGY